MNFIGEREGLTPSHQRVPIKEREAMRFDRWPCVPRFAEKTELSQVWCCVGVERWMVIGMFRNWLTYPKDKTFGDLLTHWLRMAHRSKHDIGKDNNQNVLPACWRSLMLCLWILFLTYCCLQVLVLDSNFLWIALNFELWSYLDTITHVFFSSPQLFALHSYPMSRMLALAASVTFLSSLFWSQSKQLRTTNFDWGITIEAHGSKAFNTCHSCTASSKTDK